VKIATLSIGKEVVSGEIIDTNAPFIARRLFDFGLAVSWHAAVGDDENAIIDALKLLSMECDAIIATGGLGSTVDDITTRAAAHFTGRRLILHQDAIDHLATFRSQERGGFIETNERQALLPAKAELLNNPSGTACGYFLNHNNCILFFLPGVPAEMEAMLDQSVLPAIVSRMHSRKVLKTRMLNIFGVSEVQIDQRLKELSSPEDHLDISFYPMFPYVRVKLRGEGLHAAEVDDVLDRAVQQVHERFQQCIFSEGETSMQQAVAALLQVKNQTVAVAESCTGGGIAAMLTEVPGSSSWFMEGAVTYSNSAKIGRLGVSAALIEDVGAVSHEVAEAMAEGIRSTAGTDLGLAVTGIAGPDGGSALKPVGTVYIALSSARGTTARSYLFSGNRERVRTLSSAMAMDWLRRHLLSL
jgi:nicotinamide-nucleotide amidase